MIHSALSLCLEYKKKKKKQSGKQKKSLNLDEQWHLICQRLCCRILYLTKFTIRVVQNAQRRVTWVISTCVKQENHSICYSVWQSNMEVVTGTAGNCELMHEDTNRRYFMWWLTITLEPKTFCMFRQFLMGTLLHCHTLSSSDSVYKAKCHRKLLQCWCRFAT